MQLKKKKRSRNKFSKRRERQNLVKPQKNTKFAKLNLYIALRTLCLYKKLDLQKNVEFFVLKYKQFQIRIQN
ncbi:hypothetical protein B0A81_16050 [Flavobacterium plurextorum]|uniref:Uncharacterized protein n=1 Tax=Flavobacterium plurextorum TaxID=1114867 RepID=A0ABX4CRK6_9FLAO|nr:hypothetical protein B0A81_16050 [Flavobacterium plurextorum]